jgi:hypothetical protein
MLKWFSLAAILFLFLSAVIAQDVNEDTTEQGVEHIEDAFNADEVEEEREKIVSSPDVVTHSLFPRYPDAQLPVGKVIEILFGFSNQGVKSFNVTYIQGSIRYTQDISVIIQNFTSYRAWQVIRAGEHYSFSYEFFPDELLEPKDYAFVSSVFYTDEDNVNYTTAFYNGTIYLVEDATPLDLQTFFAYFLALGIAGLLAFVGYNYLGFNKKGRSYKQAPVETGTRNANASNEWLGDSNVASWKKQKLAGSSPKKQKKN